MNTEVRPLVRFGKPALIVLVTGAVAIIMGILTGNYFKNRNRLDARKKTTEVLLQRMQSINVGDTLSEHTFEDLLGHDVALVDALPHGIILSFFSTDCYNCLAELDTLNSAVDDTLDYRYFVLISSDDRLDLQSARRDYDIRCPILWDRGGFYARQLNLSSLPFSILVTKHLEIIQISAGLMTTAEMKEVIEQCRTVM